MRKHDARKWLHAILDLLPVILIPVFMIYSHRHTIDSYSVERIENVNKTFDLTQSVVNGLPNNTTDNWYLDSGYLNIQRYNNKPYIKAEQNWDSQCILYGNLATFNSDYDYFYIHFNYRSDGASVKQYAFWGYNDTAYQYYDIDVSSGNGTISQLIQISDADDDYYQILFYFDFEGDYGEFALSDFMLINVNEFYDYQSSYDVSYFDNLFNSYIENGDFTITTLVQENVLYDDTDIGSQFMYCLYNSVDKYFNFSKVFNFDQIYDWFVLNIFNGNAPLIMPVVWNIVLYEFIMDLMFLLYGLFMFFIDTCSNLMDRFYCNLSGRR